MTLSGLPVCVHLYHSRSVSIVDRTYVFTLLMVQNDLSGVAVDPGKVRRMVSTESTFG